MNRDRIVLAFITIALNTLELARRAEDPQVASFLHYQTGQAMLYAKDYLEDPAQATAEDL
jgi:hypothetical protein